MLLTELIDYSTLLKKLELYGLAGIALDCVKCYLRNRLQVKFPHSPILL